MGDIVMATCRTGVGIFAACLFFFSSTFFCVGDGDVTVWCSVFLVHRLSFSCFSVVVVEGEVEGFYIPVLI